MKTDQDYLKKLLDAFEAAPAPITNIFELEAAGLPYKDDQFVFHMGILADQGFVERDDHEPGFGLSRGIDGHVSWAALPLRLTARGHEFAEALHNKEVWATVKKEFKDASINTLWEVSKKLLQAYTIKKVGGLIGL
jgi:hypothetical protein